MRDLTRGGTRPASCPYDDPVETDAFLDLVLMHVVHPLLPAPVCLHEWVPRLVVLVQGLWLREDIAAGFGVDPQFCVCGVSVRPHEAGDTAPAPPLAWHDVGRAELRSLLDGAVALGVPARQPALKGIMDTSDTGVDTTLTGAIDHRGFYVSLHRQCSGYGGRDADAFAHLTRLILGVARLDPHDPAWSELCRAC
jgi:hypothetical protein